MYGCVQLSIVEDFALSHGYSFEIPNLFIFYRLFTKALSISNYI